MQCDQEIVTITPINAAGVFDIQANITDVTEVLSIAVQVDAACVVQLIRGTGSIVDSLPVSLTAGQLWSAPGRLIRNKLRLSVVGTANLQVEVRCRAGECECERSHMNIISGGSAIISATPRQTFTETTAPLLANGVFTGAWRDSLTKGENYVGCTAVANQAFAATVGIQLQESEDQTNVANISAAGAANIIRVSGPLRSRYWRVVVTNGAANEASLSVITTASLIPISTSNASWRDVEVLSINTGGNLGALADNASINILRFADLTNGNFAAVAVAEHKLAGSGAGLFLARPRMPSVFKFVSATALGSTAIWTPTAGKQYRLMRFRVGITRNANLAAGAVLLVKLMDVAVDLNLTTQFFVPTTAVTTGIGAEMTPWIDLGEFGILSSAINQALNVNLSVALATGSVFVQVAGTEEP